MLMMRLGKWRDEVRRQHLHVARQHDEVDLLVAQDRQLQLLGLVLGVLLHRQVLVGHAVGVGQPARVFVVADDDRQLAVQFAALEAVQQVGHAVVELRHEQRHARLAARFGEPPRHPEAPGDGAEGGGEVGEVEVEVRQIPFDPHQEQLQLGVLVLVGVQDVGVVREQEIGDGRRPAPSGRGRKSAGRRYGAWWKEKAGIRDRFVRNHNQYFP